MTIDKIFKILQLIYIVCITVSFVVTIIKSKVSNKKIKKDCDNVLTFLFKIENVIAKAEECKNWTGNEKKQYVMSLLFNEAENYGISETQLDNLIEGFVAFTNSVNINKKENIENDTE